MGNHNIWEDIRKAEDVRKGRQEVIRSLREYLMEMNTSFFSIEELGKLINPPNFVVSKDVECEEYKNWLLRIKKRADAGILGGRHSIIRETS